MILYPNIAFSLLRKSVINAQGDRELTQIGSWEGYIEPIRDNFTQGLDGNPNSESHKLFVDATLDIESSDTLIASLSRYIVTRVNRFEVPGIPGHLEVFLEKKYDAD